MTAFGQYARATARNTVKLPGSVSTFDAAAGLLQGAYLVWFDDPELEHRPTGLTALTVTSESHEVKQGEWILIHAAAGGLGLLLCQLCRHIGAHVIGTVSTEEKAALAKANGAEHIILYKDTSMDEVAKRVRDLTPGAEGVHAVFDGVGASTFESNFISLRR